MYLRQYVSDSFHADGLAFGIFATLLVLGSASGLFVKRRHGRSSVAREIKTPSPRISAAKREEATKKPDSDFHPVVAALKADMADRRLSFGSMPGSGVEQPTTVPVPKMEAQKTSILDQLNSARQTPMTGPRPVQTGTSFAQSPPHRVEQVGGSAAPRPLPFLRSEKPTVSSVLPPTQTTTPQIPASVTTRRAGRIPAEM